MISRGSVREPHQGTQTILDSCTSWQVTLHSDISYALEWVIKKQKL